MAMAMRFKFKEQGFQLDVVRDLADCFEGQPRFDPGDVSYALDPGKTPGRVDLFLGEGFKNAELRIGDEALLENIQRVQKRRGLPVSNELARDKSCPINLDVEMETGTGKTYCYIRAAFEFSKRYGWNKYIIVTPSIAIREGVFKTLEITSDHFFEIYGQRAKFFIYSSDKLHCLESFSSDAGVNFMVINSQAFAARERKQTGGAAKTGGSQKSATDKSRDLLIYEELDDFQSRRPIDVIAANRPILILDEPQKMEGEATMESLGRFNPLMALRFSATHKTQRNKIHCLDALDAYKNNLVKKIVVRGVTCKGLAGTEGYLYSQAIEVSDKAPPAARVEFERKLARGGVGRVVKKLGQGDDLHVLSNGLDEYKGYVVSDIDAHADVVRFRNGVELQSGDVVGDLTEETLRRIQIREAVKAHLDREQSLFLMGVKAITLFFIDKVAKYRDYSRPDGKGEYARVFEEEYESYLQELLSERSGNLDPRYVAYLKRSGVERIHNGYFSIDKSGKWVDEFKKAGEKTSNNPDSYDLILKDKERLLSFEEPTRFIFSHSALREGWDNPNVFVICALKNSDSSVSRRQEVGRGLRLCVDQGGNRVDDGPSAREANALTVVASESYKDFAAALQKEIAESLGARQKVGPEFFKGRALRLDSGESLTFSQADAKRVYKFLLKNDFVDEDDFLSEAYRQARENNAMPEFPKELAHLEPYREPLFAQLDDLAKTGSIDIADGRRVKSNPINEGNFKRKEFRALWNRINRKAAYCVDFKSEELIEKAVEALNDETFGLRVKPLQYTVQVGAQKDSVTGDALAKGEAFDLLSSQTFEEKRSIRSKVKYDLVGKVAEGVKLTRRDVAAILSGMSEKKFAQYKKNPENFIAEAIRLINEQKATIIIERLSYDPLEDKYDSSIFTAGQSQQDFSQAVKTPLKNIYQYVLPDSDSKVEANFAKALETGAEVAVYAKLPRGFLIPTPVGDYNPDWAIAFREGQVKHVYFVAETKGDVSSMSLRKIEKAKIDCARKFFEEMNRRFAPQNVAYDVVDSYDKLMQIVK